MSILETALFFESSVHLAWGQLRENRQEPPQRGQRWLKCGSFQALLSAMVSQSLATPAAELHLQSVHIKLEVQRINMVTIRLVDATFSCLVAGQGPFRRGIVEPEPGLQVAVTGKVVVQRSPDSATHPTGCFRLCIFDMQFSNSWFIWRERTVIGLEDLRRPAGVNSGENR